MFDELMTQEVWRLALIAAVGGAVLGVLPRSRIRSVSVWTWALIPLAVAALALCFTDGGQLGSSLSFVGLFLLASMLPWAGLVLLPYNLVRRAREIHSGVDYRRVP